LNYQVVVFFLFKVMSIYISLILKDPIILTPNNNFFNVQCQMVHLVKNTFSNFLSTIEKSHAETKPFL